MDTSLMFKGQSGTLCSFSLFDFDTPPQCKLPWGDGPWGFPHVGSNLLQFFKHYLVIKNMVKFDIVYRCIKKTHENKTS